MTEKISVNLADIQVDDRNAAVLTNVLIIPASADVMRTGKVEIKVGESVLPHPMMTNAKNGLYKYYDNRQWFMDLQEEVYKTMKARQLWVETSHDYGEDDEESFTRKEEFAESVAEMIALSLSMLRVVYPDEKDWTKFFKAANEKNKERLYPERRDEND